MARKYNINLFTRFLIAMSGIIAVSYLGASFYIDEKPIKQPVTEISETPKKEDIEIDLIEKQKKRIQELESKLDEKAIAKSDNKPEVLKNEIFQVVEQMPRFSGCEDENDITEKKQCATKKMLQFIYKNIKYPEKARSKGIQGTVVIGFVVEKDGSLTKIKIVRNIGGGCGAEAMKVVQEMPKWIPGVQKGKNVSVQFNLPIKFRMRG